MRTPLSIFLILLFASYSYSQGCGTGPVLAETSFLNCDNQYGEELVFLTYNTDFSTSNCGSGPDEYLQWLTYYPTESEATISITDAFYAEPYPYPFNPCYYCGFITQIGIRIVEESCSGTEIFCDSYWPLQDEILLTDLVPGQAYHIAVWIPFFIPSYDLLGIVGVQACAPQLDCYDPSGLHAEDITDHRAVADWNTNTGSLWDMEYGPVGFDPGSGTTISGIQSSYQLIEDLDAESAYDFYVISDCGDNSTGNLIGPRTFTTASSMSIVNGPDDSQDFECDSYSIPESFEVFAYCEPISFFHEDVVTQFDDHQEIYRTITAYDDCGNSIQADLTVTLKEHGLPCGCESITKNTYGRSVAIDGDWAAVRSLNGVHVKHLVDDQWVDHSTIGTGIVGAWSYDYESSLGLSGERIVVGNEVFRLQNDQWTLEMSLSPSAGGEDVRAVALDGTTTLLKSETHVSIHEYSDGQWTESFILEIDAQGVDLKGNMMVIGVGEEQNLADVYRRVGGTWTLEQNLIPSDPVTTEFLAYSVSLDSGRLAIGNKFFGGIHTFEYDGVIWQANQFLEDDLVLAGTNFSGSYFGHDVDIEGDLLIAGFHNLTVNGNYSGAVVVLEWQDDQWVHQRTIVPVNGQSNDRFGGTVALSGSNLLVGTEDTQYFGHFLSTGNHWFIPCIGPSISCPADIDGNGLVDINDFIQFNSSFGASCGGCPEDINGDGLVDIDDFLILNSNFGVNCF